jgi:signal transduction histidine kinase
MNEMAELLRRAMSRPSQGVNVFRQDCTLAEAVHHAVDTVRPLADAAHVLLSVDVAPDASAMPAGPLGTVVMNGLRNAIEACAEPGVQLRRVELCAAVTHTGRELSIVIADTGGGLASTADESGKTKSGGHGIGLGVCRDLVAELGGRCSLSNLPYGEGAAFHVVVPLRSLQAA